MSEAKTILMCAPDFFDIEYEINPWMKTDNPVHQKTARDQWQQLHDLYVKLGYKIELIEPVKNLPDMVFTANGGLVIDGKAMLPRFKFPERQPETELFKKWFESYGLETHMPEHNFEGEGDALVCGDLILAGYGFRSDLAAHAELDEYFGKTVISLKLVNENFYHLDTALMILNDDTIAYYTEAFDDNSRRELELAIPHTIKASPTDAKAFGLNAVSNGHDVVMSDQAEGLIKAVRQAGFTPHPTPITEFRKSGGGVKCLTLELRK